MRPSGLVDGAHAVPIRVLQFTSMPSFPTALATLVLLVAPGLMWVMAFGGARLRLSLCEQLFLTVAGSLVVSGWVALVLAELGQFSPGRVALVVGAGVLAASIFFRKRLAFEPGRLDLVELVVAVSVLGFALLVYFPPFEYTLGGRDPGIYVNSGFHIAREGDILYVDPLVKNLPAEYRDLFFRVDKELPPWSQARFLGFYLESPESGRVLPQGFHLYPVWIAIAASLFQMKSGLYVTPFFALMGVVGYFLASRRLFGSEVAVWSTVLVATFQIQVWFARFPSAEVMVQFLYALGLWAFFFMQEKRSPLAGVLSGLAIGSILLLRLESILFLVPVGLYMGWHRLRRQFAAPELGFLVPFLLLGAHAIVHARIFAGPYVGSVFSRWYWRWVADNLPVLAIAGLVAFLAVDRFAPGLAGRALELARRRAVGISAALVVFALASYAYFIRPVWHAARTAPHDAEAFLRMSWYLYPFGVALAIAGVMLIIAKPQRRWAFFVLVGLTFSVFFFYKIRVSNDHFFGMRRFFPIILPTFFIALSYFLVRLREQFGRLGGIAATVIGLLLVVIYTADGRPLWTHNEFRGSLDFVEELARHIDDDDVVIFPRHEGLHLMELPLAELHGRQVIEFYTLRPNRLQLEGLLKRWRKRYGDVFFITNYKVSLSGLFTRHVKDFLWPTEIYEYTYLAPPKKAVPFSLGFTLSKAVDLDALAARVPPLTRIDVGGQGDGELVAWFHGRELDSGVSYRWSQQTSSVFLPGANRRTKSLRLRLAGAREGEVPLSEVTIRLADRVLGTIVPGRDFEVVTVEVPEEVASLLDREHGVARIDTKPWRPKNLIEGADDSRDLGIRLDWIERVLR